MTTHDSVIYHYCPCDAFAQVVRTKTLWLTDMFSTNDKEEHRWFRKIAAEVIEMETKQPSRKWDDGTMRLLRDMSIDRDGIGNIFLACFSRRGDSLGHWRAYADDGHGVAIGFSQAYMLAKQREMGRTYLEVLEVEYQADRHKQLVRDAIVAAEQERRAASRVLTEAERDACDGNFHNTFLGKVWNYAPQCKHQAFEEEEEVRVVCYPVWGLVNEDRRLKSGHRTSRGAITRFYELPIGVTDQQPIREIRLGPKNTSRLSHVEEFLADNGYDSHHIAISKSDAPYR